MRPGADEIIDSVVKTFEEYIVPEVDEPFAQSLALTMANLMRLVHRRIVHEGPVRFADIADLRDTLGTVRDYLVSDPERDGGFTELVGDIDETVAGARIPEDEYPTLARTAEVAAALRWSLQRALTALEGARAGLGEQDEYREVRRQVRGYLRRSLEREGSLILPAFTGERR